MIRLKYIAILILLHNPLQAQGPPITAETPIMLGLEGSGIRSFLKITDTEDHRTTSWIIGIPYNIHTNFQVGAVAPYQWLDEQIGTKRKGLGDMTFFSKSMVFKKDGKARTVRVLAMLRQSFPTSSTSLRGTDKEDIYRTYLGLVFGRITTRLGVYGDVGYRFDSNDLKDHLLYNFSVGVPVLAISYPQKQLNAYLEVNGDHVIGGRELITLSPGLQVIPGRRFLVEVNYSIPLTGRDLIDWSAFGGIRFLLN